MTRPERGSPPGHENAPEVGYLRGVAPALDRTGNPKIARARSTRKRASAFDRGAS